MSVPSSLANVFLITLPVYRVYRVLVLISSFGLVNHGGRFGRAATPRFLMTKAIRLWSNCRREFRDADTFGSRDVDHTRPLTLHFIYGPSLYVFVGHGGQTRLGKGHLSCCCGQRVPPWCRCPTYSSMHRNNSSVSSGFRFVSVLK